MTNKNKLKQLLQSQLMEESIESRTVLFNTIQRDIEKYSKFNETSVSKFEQNNIVQILNILNKIKQDILEYDSGEHV